jgi:predicted secreted protein
MTASDPIRYSSQNSSCVRACHALLAFCLLSLVSVFAVASTLAQNRTRTSLRPNQPITFVLAPGGEKAFVIQLKKDDVAEVSWQANEELNLSLTLRDPSGKDLIKEGPEITDSIPFVASLDGEYLLTITMKTAQDSPKAKGSQKITLQYTNRWQVPTGISKSDVRKVNGYDIKILETPGHDGKSYLLIERNGRLKKVFEGAAQFSFGDDASNTESDGAKGSATLVGSTPDKTGDGNPDVEVGYFSGGAHCCFVTFFFELGASVKVLPSFSTHNAELFAIGRNPKGGLRFETFDDTFAYWLTDYADSPMPRVVLEFQKGVLRPNFDLMKKPAPSLAKLKEMARAKRTKISLKPYRGVKGSGIDEEVFWDVMLDLIYTGHEELAWQYLDLVWPAQKKGKELFIKDFKHTLSESPFWKVIVESNNQRK